VRLGKQAQFPLRDEALRVRMPGSVADEEPARLLLNPCSDDPEKHLTFDDKGLVHAASNDAGVESDMGAYSIDVYALQRKGLVEERYRVLTSLKFNIGLLRKFVMELARLRATDTRDAAAIVFMEQQIANVTNELIRITARDAPYLSMIRGYVRRTKKNGELRDLENTGIDLETLLQDGRGAAGCSRRPDHEGGCHAGGNAAAVDARLRLEPQPS